MREQTLRHLLLHVGRELDNQEVDAKTRRRIREAVDTLKVKYNKIEGFSISCKCDDRMVNVVAPKDDFQFHVRGDREGVPFTGNTQERNYESALKIWSIILGSPARIRESNRRTHRVRRRLLLTSAYVLSFSLMFLCLIVTGDSLGIIGILFTGEFMRNASEMVLHNKIRRILLVGLAVFGGFQAAIACCLSIVIGIELLPLSLSHGRRSSIARVGLVETVTVFMFILLPNLSHMPINISTTNVLGMCISFATAACGLLYGNSKSMRRVSLPIAIGSLLLLIDMSFVSSLCLIFYGATHFPLNITRSCKEAQVEGTPVRVRPPNQFARKQVRLVDGSK